MYWVRADELLKNAPRRTVAGTTPQSQSKFNRNHPLFQPTARAAGIFYFSAPSIIGASSKY
jgi:hypothetical protein